MGSQFFNNFKLLDYIFFVFALSGTLFFLLKTIMMFIVGVSEDIQDISDTDVDADTGDIGHDFDDPGHTDSSVSFKLLSLHSLTGFVMMFGWIGLACHLQYKLQSVISTIAGAAAGFITMWITAKLFQLAKKLSHSGARYDLKDAVGQTVIVYQTIPVNGTGKVTVTLAGEEHQVPAAAKDGQEIKSFERVTITSIINEAMFQVDKTETK